VADSCSARAQQQESPEIARLMKHELSLSPEFIQASRSCQGDSARLRKFLQKLLRGEAVSVATIGGSVTGTLLALSCT
jgi:hypothetical protein